LKNDKILKPLSLLPSIQKAYSKIMLSILVRRMRSYHKSFATEYWHKLDGPLYDCLKNVSQTRYINHPDDFHSIQKIVDKFSTTQFHTTDHTTINTEHVNELSQYFKRRSMESTLTPGIDEKLKHSIWQHIHHALRLAREKKNKDASMHADIAYYACKELAHYLPEQEYYEFINEIKDELKHLNNLSMQSELHS